MAKPDLFCKVDANLDHNPKIRRGGRLAREVYEFVLRRNRLVGRDGRLSASNVDPDYLSDELMTPRSEVEKGMRRAVEVGLLALEGDQVAIVGWSEEWGRTPRTAAERQADRRARLRDQSRTSRDVTNERDAEVTGHGCHGSDQRRSDQIPDRAREDSHSFSTEDPEQPVDRFGPKPTDRANVVDLAAALRKVFPEGS